MTPSGLLSFHGSKSLEKDAARNKGYDAGIVLTFKEASGIQTWRTHPLHIEYTLLYSNLRLGALT